MNIVGISGVGSSGKDTAADFLVKNHGFVKVAFADPLKRTVREIYPKIPKDHLWGASILRGAPLLDYPREHGPWVTRNDDDGFCMCCGISVRARGNCYLTARYALQKLGTEWGRDCYPNTWTEYFIDTAKILFSDPYTVYSQEDGMVPRIEQTPQGEWHSNILYPKGTPRGIVAPDLRWPEGNEGLCIHQAGGKIARMTRGQGLGAGANTHISETLMQKAPDSAFNKVFDNREWSLEQLEAEVAQWVSSNL